MTRVTNFQRAHWAAIAIKAFRDEVGTDDDLASIHDLIADLAHYCALNRLDFVRICADAISCWQAELADPNDDTIEAGPDVSILIAGRRLSARHWRQSTTLVKARPRQRRGGEP